MIELSSQPKTIQSLYGWYRTGKLFVNRRYQRKLVWTLLEKQKLVDSVMNNFPVPAVILAEQPGEQDVYEVIDGLQRLHAILSFVETAFPDEDGKYFDLESFPTARGFKNEGFFDDSSGGEVISTQAAARFLDYSMSAAIVRNATDEDINEIFDRINTYGHRLSNQERRQAGVASDFARTVRQLSASLRDDVSREKLPLFDMPSISIEKPTTKHGYQVKAEDVFWVKHGVVLAGDLRESQDEECVADLAASVVQGAAINRARATLDALYDESEEEGASNAAAFIRYGEEKLVDEIKFVISEIETLSSIDNHIPLKRRLFAKVQGNAVPTIFSTIFLALHRKIVAEGKRIADYKEMAKALNNLGDKLDAGKKGASIEQRKQNIDMVCGVIDPHMVVDASIAMKIYNNHNIVAIEDSIRRSQIETAAYELKGGLLALEVGSTDPRPMMEKIAKTLVGISNNGPGRHGKLILGVCDKDADANRVKEIDKVSAREVASRKVVGVDREALRLGISVERYIQVLRDYIAKSQISSPLREQILADLDYNDYYGLGVIIALSPHKKKCLILAIKLW